MVDMLINVFRPSNGIDWIVWLILCVLPITSLVLLYLSHRYRKSVRKLQTIVNRYDSVHQSANDFMDTMAAYMPSVMSSTLSSLEQVQSLGLSSAEYLSELKSRLEALTKLTKQIEIENTSSEAKTDTKNQIIFGKRPNILKSWTYWLAIAPVILSIASLNSIVSTDLTPFTQAGVLVFDILLFTAVYSRYGLAKSSLLRAEKYASLKVSSYEARRIFIYDTGNTIINHQLEMMKDSQKLTAIPQARGFFNGLVMLSKLGNGTLSVYRAGSMDSQAPLFSVDIFLQKLIDKRYRPAATERHLTLHSEIGKGLAFQIYPKDFTELIDNLVSNAISNSKPGTKVVVKGRNRRDKIVISITDTGNGMDRKQLEYLFSHHRVGQAENEPFTKVSLGLLICKVIVCRVGGELKIASKPGKGTVATIVAPRKQTQLKLSIPRHITTRSGSLG